MKLYCDTIASKPYIREKLDYLTQIPINIKRYYKDLGPDIIKRNSYLEARLARIINARSNHDLLKEAIMSTFIPGQFYSLKEIKSTLETIYTSLGIEKTAKASDLLNLDYIEVKPAQLWIDGHKDNGYRIL